MDSFGDQNRAFGVRVDALDSIRMFATRESIEKLMAFLGHCGVKFLNIGSIFAGCGGKQISSFAVDNNFLTPAIFKENFPAGEAANFAVQFFHGQKTQEFRAEFAKFCDAQAHWLNGYSLFCALAKQIGSYDFSTWPEILRMCSRKTAEIVKRQLESEVLLHKIMQFFARKQLALLRDLANGCGIFLCGDCDILCENFSADVWDNQGLFFVNDLGKATVFTGLPPSETCKKGLKTTKVPYRIGHMKNSNYEFLDRMFFAWQNMFDAVFLLNGHGIFQYWEIPCDESDPKHGRWVNLPADAFFGHMDSHFNNFPYLFDFNEPLFPQNEIISKRHSMLQVAIDGEPASHSNEVYDLRRDIFAIASRSCDRKTGRVSTFPGAVAAQTRSCLDNFKAENYKLCILDFEEICSTAKSKWGSVVSDPRGRGEAFASFAEHYRCTGGYAAATLPKGGDSAASADAGKASLAQKTAKFFKDILNR
jgi:hypothetical protein